MKKIIFLTAFIAVCSVSCAQKITEFVAEKTDYAGQKTETKEFGLNSFKAIHSSAAIRVIVKKADERKIIIKSNAMQFVRADVSNGKLSIYFDNKNQSLNNVYTEAEIFTPDFDALDASSAAKITVEEGFKLQNLEIYASSAAKIFGNFSANNINVETSSAAVFQANVDCNMLDIDASSSSTSEISGIAQSVIADASSTAKVDLRKLKYTSIKKDVSSLGRVIEP